MVRLDQLFDAVSAIQQQQQKTFFYSDIIFKQVARLPRPTELHDFMLRVMQVFKNLTGAKILICSVKGRVVFNTPIFEIKRNVALMVLTLLERLGTQGGHSGHFLKNKCK